FRGEPHQSFVRVALFVVTNAPRVRREDPLFEDPAQFRLAAALEFYEVLNLLVRAEFRRLIESFRRPGVLLCKRASHEEGARSIHSDINGDKRECRRKILECENGCGE